MVDIPSDITALHAAVAANPNDVEKLNALAYALILHGRIAEAAIHLDQALRLNPQHLATLWHSAVVALKSGQLERSLMLLYEVLRISPDHREAREKIRTLHRRMIEPWHFSMLNDSVRNAAFEKAICSQVKPGSIVVEVGTGSGLLAMLAARAGAKHVYTIEKSFPLANVARHIIAKNGFGDRITVINKWSSAVEIGKDIPQQGDLLIAEILGSAVVDEQVICFLNDARQRLLKPGGAVIPLKATLIGALLECETLRNRVKVNSACGFDIDR